METQQFRDRRPDALGDLRVLPDDFLCAILELLSPPDLARLACVSSVMYMLCNEEPLWMNQCLKVGGLLEYKGSWKKTTLHRQNIYPKNEETCRKPLQFDGFYSFFLYRRWYRCFTTLNSFSLDSRDLERKKDLTLDEFHSEYDGKKPVLLTEMAETWPARTKWTIDQLLLNYGDVTLGISQRSSKKITMKFKDYVSYMKLQHDEDPLYVFDDKFGEAAPALLEDYNVPHLFQEDFFDVLDHDQRPSFRWLIIGPERSGASWHVDPALTSAWNTLLSGRKRWALYPPGRVPAGVTVHVNEEDGDVNIESPTSLQWWLDIYPQLADHDKPLECTQLPGETIFVPSGWWHCVLNLETTIAITQNFVNASNFEFVCLDMAPGHHHKGVSRAGLLAVQDKGFGNVENNAFLETNSFNFPDMTRKEKRLKHVEPGKEPSRYGSSWHAKDEFSEAHSNLWKQKFSYDIDLLSTFLEEDRDHYNSIWSASNSIGQREMREWLHKLWITKPAMRQLIWKGAQIALNVDRWYACMLEICACHNLPSPMDDEKLPVGTGSNPVFLVSDYVIKIYAEGGLESAIHGLGTELEFYDLLHKAKSPLIDHVPEILASGILVYESGRYRTFRWEGKGVPDVIVNCNLIKGECVEVCFPFGVWSKIQFVLKKSGSVSCTRIWPYIVTKRCKGNIFAHLRDTLSDDDVLHLASFLGDQLRNLHLLPLPHFQHTIHSEVNNLSLARTFNSLVESSKTSATNASARAVSEGFNIPLEWELVIADLDIRKKNIKNRLVQWGDPIPGLLIENVEEYLPRDLTMFLDLIMDNDGLYKVCESPTWIHSDIMDDNIHMEPCLPMHRFGEDAPHASVIANGKLDSSNGERGLRKWHPTHILDFSNLSIGDPLYDLIPIYLDVFRGDAYLLKKLLESYKLPLAGRIADLDAFCWGPVDNQKKLKRISYRAMCYCILHEENVLGAIFSLWKELRTAKSWEEVEEVVWGELNDYQSSD
ncbi:F-box protein At1g78280 [Phoenix dactylifera]|uniref:F-box protein At1g78280 n=1 Tax=Phoenix dactylifera TaxID=42345 RepID=A0A8B7CRL0_PHODC|nr:F-box protein At1g78280 [Phoenix dactylifera]